MKRPHAKISITALSMLPPFSFYAFTLFCKTRTIQRMADSVKAFIHVGFAAAIATVFALPQTAHAQHASPALSLAASAKGTAQRVWHDTQDVAIFALRLLGVDYRFGGTTPERGLDCSGLVRYVFQQVTGVVLPRTSSEMSRLGDRVDVSELRMGDLVFSTRAAYRFHTSASIWETAVSSMPPRAGTKSRLRTCPKPIGGSTGTARAG